MEAAEHRLVRMFALSMVLIGVMIYLAFRSFLDAAVVLANILGMAIGGVWALKIAGLYFNVSAAVGFISVLGVAVMNGLLMVSAFNGLRAKGMDLNEALLQGTRQLVRPIVMTALAAMLGLLPAALSTEMGSESQKPLAIVVVGGMVSTLVCLNLVPILYSFYGRRTPPAGAGGTFPLRHRRNPNQIRLGPLSQFPVDQRKAIRHRELARPLRSCLLHHVGSPFLMRRVAFAGSNSAGSKGPFHSR